jgi:hypothetical protein
MNSTTKTLFLMGLLALSGCASNSKPLDITELKPYKSNPEYSFAKNVAVASGLDSKKIKDVKLSKEQYLSLNNVSSNVAIGGASMVSIGMDVSLAAFSDSLGLGFGPSAILNILSTFNTPLAMERYSFYFGWIDGSTGTTPMEDSANISNRINESIKTYLDNLNLKHRDSLKGTKEYSFEGYTVMNGKECDSDQDALGDCFIGTSRSINQPIKPHTGDFIGGIEAYSPDFLNAQKSNYIRGALIDFIIRQNIKIEDHSSIHLWEAVSKDLPKEIYLYLGPRQYTHKNANGDMIYGKAPLILNNGNVHFFAVQDENIIAHK